MLKRATTTTHAHLMQHLHGAHQAGPKRVSTKGASMKKSNFLHFIQGPLNGRVSNGGVSRSGLVLPFLSFFVFFCPFWDFPDFSGIFPICSGMVRGFSRFVLFLFLSLLRAPTRNSPERVRDTIWTFPEKMGNPPVWKPPGLASLNLYSSFEEKFAEIALIMDIPFVKILLVLADS